MIRRLDHRRRHWRPCAKPSGRCYPIHIASLTFASPANVGHSGTVSPSKLTLDRNDN